MGMHWTHEDETALENAASSLYDHMKTVPPLLQYGLPAWEEAPDSLREHWRQIVFCAAHARASRQA